MTPGEDFLTLYGPWHKKGSFAFLIICTLPKKAFGTPGGPVRGLIRIPGQGRVRAEDLPHPGEGGLKCFPWEWKGSACGAMCFFPS